jgi:hypothetical protein
MQMDTKISLFVFCKRDVQLVRSMRISRQRRMPGEEPGMPVARTRPLHTKTSKTIGFEPTPSNAASLFDCSRMTTFQPSSSPVSWFSPSLADDFKRGQGDDRRDTWCIAAS